MDCPYCGKSMEEGVIRSLHEIAWKREKKFFGGAAFHKGSVVLSETDIVYGGVAVAHLCRDCKKSCD